MVVLYHTPGLQFRIPFVHFVQPSLWLGVDLFMLISGWLLGGQLLREAAANRWDPARFYMKRWMRTLPAYYAMLAILYHTRNAEFGGPLPWQTVLKHCLFLQTYLLPNLYPVSWSLCVEEHFYLLLPLIVWILIRRPRFDLLVGIVIAVEVVAVCGRAAGYSPNNSNWTPQATHLRTHGLFLGLLLAWISIHRPLLWSRLGAVAARLGGVGLVATVLVMASVPDRPSFWTYVVVPTLGTWTLALLFLACVHEGSSWSRAGTGWRGLRYFGELTYAIYLTHHTIPRDWVGGHASEAGIGGLLLRLALMLAASLLLHHLVERPALRLREVLLRRWPLGARRVGVRGPARA